MTSNQTTFRSNVLADDSPFRRLLPENGPRPLSLLDGIRYSIDMTAISYTRLRLILVDAHARLMNAAAEKTTSPPVPTHSYAGAFLDAWSMIDSADRLRRLLPHVPKSKSNPAIRDFTDTCEPIEQLRHCIQHLDGQLAKLTRTRTSTWGEIDFCVIPHLESTRGWTGILGSMTMSREVIEAHRHPFAAIKGDGPFEHPIDLLHLTAHGVRVSLSDLHRRVQRVARSLEEALSSQFQLGDPTPDLFILFDLAFGEANGVPIGSEPGQASAFSISTNVPNPGQQPE